MKIVYHSTVCDFPRFCMLGKKFRLYAEWGTMQYWYQWWEGIDAMAIAYHKGTPIGMAMLMKHYHKEGGVRFGVFVRLSMRRQGIGRHLYSLVKKRTGQTFMVAKYDDQQTEFFDSLGVRGYREYIESR